MSLSQRTNRLALRPRVVAVCSPDLILLSLWKTAEPLENVHLGEISLFIKYDTEKIVSDFNVHMGYFIF